MLLMDTNQRVVVVTCKKVTGFIDVRDFKQRWRQASRLFSSQADGVWFIQVFRPGFSF